MKDFSNSPVKIMGQCLLGSSVKELFKPAFIIRVIGPVIDKKKRAFTFCGNEKDRLPRGMRRSIVEYQNCTFKSHEISVEPS